MNSNASNKCHKPNQLNPKSAPSKSRSKRKPTQQYNKEPKPISTEDKEILPETLAANKSQITNLNILSKSSRMTRRKTYEIQSIEEVTFLLSFEIVKEKMKITVIENDSFPQKKYENYYSLENFIAINRWFNIFNNIETLLTELEQLTKNEYFTIEQKNKNVISLFINFPIDHLDKIEILLRINDKTEIKSIEYNEIAFFKEKNDNNSHLLQSTEEVNKAREEEILLNQQNENKSDKNINLEEMKDALKLQIEKKIKNHNDTKDTNNVNKEEKRREEKRREEKRREEKRR